jgi:hypothetical protein
LDLPHIYVSVTFYNALMAGLTTAVFFHLLTMSYLFWRERSQRRNQRP